MKLVIDRNKWLRGEGSLDSFLLRPSDQKMCCLGFYSLKLGYTKDEIAAQRELCFVAIEKGNRYPEEAVKRPNGYVANSKPIKALMEVNDSKELTEEEREDKVKEEFAKLGVEVEFVGEK